MTYNYVTWQVRHMAVTNRDIHSSSVLVTIIIFISSACCLFNKWSTKYCMCKTIGYKGKSVWVMILLGTSQVSPGNWPLLHIHTPLSSIRGLFQCASICSCKSSCPLSRFKVSATRGFSYIEGSAGIYKDQTSIRWRCPLFGVSVIRCYKVYSHTS